MLSLQDGTDHAPEEDKTPSIRLSFDLPEGISYARCVRRTAAYLLKNVGVSQEDVNDLEVVVGELATNVVRHSQNGNYSVSIELHGNQAEIVVADKGVGFDLRCVPEMGTLRPDGLSEENTPRIGGFGLPLVYSLADHVSVEHNQPKGMVVRARKEIHYS